LNQEIILDLIFFFVILRSSADVEWQRFFVYLLCTAKPAFVGFWDFSVFGKSITYLFSVPLGRSIPSLATILTALKSIS
jgi:hypothetical protein